ncbi:phage minor head protein [Brucella melitensis]|uniref:phage minor head protein n=1 Tax=Brucella melitensis TaxID=29459 RepID=UPI0032BF6AA2
MATTNTRLMMEAVRHRLYITRYSNGVANKMIALLRKLNVDVSGRLLVALEKDGISAENYTVKRLERIKATIAPTIKQIYRTTWGQLAAELQELAEGEASYQLKMLRQLIPTPIFDFVDLKALPPEQVYAAAMSRPFQGMLLKDIPTVLGDDLTRTIGNAVQQGILQGETYDQITRRVRGTAITKHRDGILATSERHLATVTRSAVSHVAAEARDEIGKANDHLIKAEQWLSTLDGKTSKMCIIRDRLMYKRDKKHTPIGHSVPYGAGPGRLHFNCRSTSTYKLKSWRELGIDIDSIDSKTRASMNGQVSAKMNYGQWVEQQPLSTLTEVFGVERGQLLKDGKISVPELYSDTGEYLSLAQLRALDRIPDDD